MSCSTSCKNAGGVNFPLQSSAARALLRSWTAGMGSGQKIYFTYGSQEQEGMLSWALLAYSETGGRSVLVLPMGVALRCRVWANTVSATRYGPCGFCFLESKSGELGHTSLVSLAHLSLQANDAPVPAKLTAMYILKSIKVKMGSRKVPLLTYLLRRINSWMLTSTIPRFFLVHTFRLANACQADCHKWICPHKRPQEIQGNLVKDNEVIYSIPGSASPWTFTQTATSCGVFLDPGYNLPQQSPAPRPGLPTEGPRMSTPGSELSSFSDNSQSPPNHILPRHLAGPPLNRPQIIQAQPQPQANKQLFPMETPPTKKVKTFRKKKVAAS